LGGVLAGFLFKSETISYAEAFLYIGLAVATVGALTALIKFDKKALVEPKVALEVV
jgi:MFS transporter, NNP family, nitrate/nitrite transporter